MVKFEDVIRGWEQSQEEILVGQHKGITLGLGIGGDILADLAASGGGLLSNL